MTREAIVLNRRDFLGAALGLGVEGISWPAPAKAAPMTYEQAVDTTWAPLQTAPRDRELVRFATLAANSHNTQPWTFAVGDNEITVAPDFHRRCPAVDPDDHHLFASLGCAVENLAHAAAAFGLKATTMHIGDRLVTGLEPAP